MRNFKKQMITLERDKRFKYKNKILRDKEQIYTQRYGNSAGLPQQIMKLLGEEIQRDLKIAIKEDISMVGANHNTIFNKYEKKFKKRKEKLRELLLRRHHFKPEYSLLSLAKQIICSDNKLSLFQVKKMLKNKESLNGSALLKINNSPIIRGKNLKTNSYQKRKRKRKKQRSVFYSHQRNNSYSKPINSYPKHFLPSSIKKRSLYIDKNKISKLNLSQVLKQFPKNKGGSTKKTSTSKMIILNNSRRSSISKRNSVPQTSFRFITAIDNKIGI